MVWYVTMIPRFVKDLLFGWKAGRSQRKGRAWNVAPLALRSNIWREKNMRAFERVEICFDQLSSSP